MTQPTQSTSGPFGPGVLVVNMLKLVATAALACLFLAVIGQVLLRNLFSTGLIWSDELARFCCLAMVFLMVPVLVLRNGLVAVCLLGDKTEARLDRPLLLLAALCIMVFGGLMVWALAQFLDRAAFFTTPSLGLPNWIFYGPAILGFALTALMALRIAWVTLTLPPKAPMK